jgi:hypothetical protein
MISLVQKLARFSACYDTAHLKIWRRRAAVPEDNDEIRRDSLKGMFLFTMYAHERQGSNPQFALFHRIALLDALGERNFDDALFHDENFSSEVWQGFHAVAQGRTNELITLGPVKEILDSMRKAQESNLLVLLQRKDCEQTFQWLNDIRGIGPKLAAFFTRDLATILRLWPNIPDGQLYCVQPFDVWIRRLAIECWRTQFHESSNVFENMKQLSRLCVSSEISPAEFNKGAWFVGSHFYNLCDFFNVKQSERLDMSACVLNHFDENHVREAIMRYADESATGSIFAV